jgi:nickel/cobalt transporter (NicO) family protein
MRGPLPNLKAALVWLVALTQYSVLSTQYCFAHPVPKTEYDRNATVTWQLDAIQVLYRVEIDEFTLLKTVGDPANGFPLNPKKGLGRKDLGDAYISVMKKVIPDSLVALVDGKEVKFTCTDARVEFLDSAQFRFRLKASVPLNPGRHSLEAEDLNFTDKPGKVILKFDSDSAFKVEKVTESREGSRVEVPESERRKLAATVFLPEFTTERGPMPRVIDEIGSEESVESTADQPPAGFWDLLRQVQETEKLSVLFDSKVGFWMIMLLAALHGVLHSVSPGHGKTMVAAYLVGEQGTPRHAIILGLIVTLTHTSASFAVALLLKFVLPQEAAPTIQRVLGIGGGALVIFIGLWLLMSRLSGRSDHVHVGGSHSHSHGDDSHSHSHGLTPEQFGRVSWVRLILLGISGGIIPCWGAILWVIYCVTAGRYGLAVWAVLSFSIGLASVLILIGLSVVWSSRMGGRAFSGKGWFSLVSKWLPIIGAALVVVIGFWLVRSNLPK